MNSTSPLHEEVSMWMATSQGTIEDRRELERILGRYRRPDAALGYILDRISHEDVPLHVAADITQFVWEQDYLEATRTFAIATDHPEGWAPAGTFDTAEEAQAQIQPWMHAYVIARTIIETRVPVTTAHGEIAPSVGV
ncbi:hypothetical protein [Microbacterium sp. 77mftsu3.1]|uniref:hypothetical protein n=1 Tax=Microbacterium sp. 77mftsu3.1 TaxID=1761802 RepID=UPI000890F2D5|nr:hypothetical protein [Microbacterium sp. 77mftsu3.1]SDH38056.1 hypothetical protein SAMN04488590_3184 [Microbacterium sp. 77mftsu3.1]